MSEQQLPRPGLGAYLLLPLLYFVAARFCGAYTVSPEGMGIIWAPNAVLLGVLLYYQGQGYLRFAVLAVIAEMLGDLPYYPVQHSFFFGLVDTLEATLAWLLMRRAGMSTQLGTVEDLAKFMLAGPVLAALAGGTLGALTLYGLGVSQNGLLSMTRVWWFGDALGYMIMTPLLLYLAQPASRCGYQYRQGDLVALVFTLAVAAALVAAEHGALQGVSVTPAVLLPSLLYLATRFHPAWSALGVALVAMTVAVLITRGHHPFGKLPLNEEVMRGQEFILIMSLLGTGFAALMSEIREHKRSLEARVAERTSLLLKLNADLAHQAQTDGLTGLLNRRAFYEAAQREVERSTRFERPLAVLMLDLDHFKAINDSHGHLVGDKVLSHFASLLRQTARGSDVVARYGGEEFVVLLPESSLEPGMALAERLRENLRDSPLLIDGQAIAVTASMGLTVLRPPEGVEAMLSRADTALYHAKSGGRDRIMEVG